MPVRGNRVCQFPSTCLHLLAEGPVRPLARTIWTSDSTAGQLRKGLRGLGSETDPAAATIRSLDTAAAGQRRVQRATTGGPLARHGLIRKPALRPVEALLLRPVRDRHLRNDLQQIVVRPAGCADALFHQLLSDPRQVDAEPLQLAKLTMGLIQFGVQ